MRIFAVNGVAKSGKDSFCNLVRNIAADREQEVTTISTIDPIKQLYSDFFKWDGDKFKDHHRKNLNTLKQVWISSCNGPNTWTKETLKKLNDKGCDIVFIMVREFEEMMDIVQIGEEYFGNCKTVQVIRLGLPIPPVEKEFLESHPESYVYDWMIHNPNTNDPNLPILKKAANIFLNRIDTNLKHKVNFDHSPLKYMPSGKSIRDLIYDTQSTTL